MIFTFTLDKCTIIPKQLTVKEGDTVVVNPTDYPWDNSLGQDQDCRYLLQSPALKKIEVTITEFYLRDKNDWLALYDGLDILGKVLAK